MAWIAPIVGAAASLAGGLMGSGKTSSSTSVAPPTQEEIDIIYSLMAAGAPSKQTASVTDQEVEDAYSSRAKSGRGDFLKTLAPGEKGKRVLTPEQQTKLGLFYNNMKGKTVKGASFATEDILNAYDKAYGSGTTASIDKGALRAELLSTKQAELDKAYTTEKTAYDAKQGNLEKSLAPSDADKQIQDLFRSKVTGYLSRKEDGSVDPAAFEAAKSFVDQTFTAPAEEQLRMAQSDFEQGAAARNAALGRGGSDSAFQQLLFGNLANQRAQLGSQRGAMIADEYTNKPIRDIGVGMQGLQGVSAIQNQSAFAPSFLNSLNQQAISNRMNLLNNLTNARTGNQTTSNSGPDIGLLGQLSQGAQLGQGIGDLFRKPSSGTAQEYAPASSGEYQSSAGGNFWNVPKAKTGFNW